MRTQMMLFVFWLVQACRAGFTNEVRVASREELLRALESARPGVTILVAPGTYQGGIVARGLKGSKENPIVIAGSDPKNPPVLEGGASCLHFQSPQHVVLRNLVLTKARANGLNIDDSGSTTTPARHVVIQNVTVRETGSAGNHDGFKLSGLDSFRISSCTIDGWGRNGSAMDLVGCHHGVITECLISDATSEFANGIQAKGGSEEIVIQRCRFRNAGGRGVNVGGNTGLDYFRPKPQGFEARKITVEDCEFIGGAASMAFVGVDGAIVQNNIIYRPQRWVIRILQENTDPQFVPCRNVEFLKNVIAFQSEQVRTVVNIGPKTDPGSFVYRENVWYCQDCRSETRRIVQLSARETGGTYEIDPQIVLQKNGTLEWRKGLPGAAGPRQGIVHQD